MPAGLQHFTGLHTLCRFYARIHSLLRSAARLPFFWPAIRGSSPPTFRFALVALHTLCSLTPHRLLPDLWCTCSALSLRCTSPLAHPHCLLPDLCRGSLMRCTLHSLLLAAVVLWVAQAFTLHSSGCNQSFTMLGSSADPSGASMDAHVAATNLAFVAWCSSIAGVVRGGICRPRVAHTCKAIRAA